METLKYDHRTYQKTMLLIKKTFQANAQKVVPIFYIKPLFLNQLTSLGFQRLRQSQMPYTL